MSLISNIRKFCEKNAPEILTGATVILIPVTGYLAANAAVKSSAEVEAQEDFKDKIKVAAPYYAPAISTGFAACCFAIAANRTQHKRLVALGLASAMSEKAFGEITESVKSQLGEEAYNKVMDEMGQRAIEKKASVEEYDDSDIPSMMGSKTETLCYDIVIDRYFRADINDIRSAVNEFNAALMDGGFHCMNEFYSEYLLLPTIGIGDDLGWDINGTGLLVIDYGSALAPTDEPCVTINYSADAKYNYYGTYGV